MCTHLLGRLQLSGQRSILVLQSSSVLIHLLVVTASGGKLLGVFSKILYMCVCVYVHICIRMCVHMHDCHKCG